MTDAAGAGVAVGVVVDCGGTSVGVVFSLWANAGAEENSWRLLEPGAAGQMNITRKVANKINNLIIYLDIFFMV